LEWLFVSFYFPVVKASSSLATSLSIIALIIILTTSLPLALSALIIIIMVDTKH
jgi:hypothetical protein